MSNTIKPYVEKVQLNTRLTLAEMARILDYAPAYFIDQVNKGTSTKLFKAIKQQFPNEGVGYAGEGSNTKKNEAILIRIAALEKTVRILTVELSGLLSQSSGKPLSEVLAMLEKAAKSDV